MAAHGLCPGAAGSVTQEGLGALGYEVVYTGLLARFKKQGLWRGTG